MTDDSEPRLEDYSPDEIDVEAISAFHLRRDLFCASVQLSDQNNEAGRSFLVRMSLAEQIRYEVLLEIEDLILSHVSLSSREHIALQVGGTTHHLSNGTIATAEGPEAFTNRLWHLDEHTVYLYGDEGTVCFARGTEWVPIKAVTTAFLRAMHGPGPELIHVAGDHGTLLHLDGLRWRPISLGFNHSISALQVARDGDVYLGCENGFCARYANEELTEIAGPGTQIYSICEFAGNRYWGDDEYGLYIQKEMKLVPFRSLGFVYAMHATEAFLVAVGWKEIFAFNGREWSGVEFGYDGSLFVRRIDMTREFL
ncbi:hypothetical protein AU381_24965 [Sinorhizobium glycinis]|uniref:Uncharacterized protein n=1 Tax=Sinorhizobium glycinis TaxID=1472378 RepID=A0A178XH48_9HYPH|nr:hypothetical protein [Sinorhizobium glycinis]OAP34577.1 hypothetical protein AU381_24965 [Sinorhizobium glycinis]